MADECADLSAATEPNPGLLDPPHVGDQMMASFDRDLKDIVEENETKHGLAILVGIGVTGLREAAGVKEDVKKMQGILEKLGVAVWKMMDQTNVEVTGALRAVAKCTFPEKYKFIIFYFSGNGGSRDGHAYVQCQKDVITPVDTLSIERGIVAHFLKKNAPQLKELRRIFLFDCCLKDATSLEPEACRLEDISLPSFDTILIAYATSMTVKAKGDNSGGLWTTFLSKNMNLDCPLTSVLDFTWEEVVLEFNKQNASDVRQGAMIPQGPHYASSAGLIWLCHPDWDWEKGQRYLPRWIGDDEEEDELEKPPPKNVTYKMGGINIASGVNIGAVVTGNVGQVSVTLADKSKASEASSSAAEVDTAMLADYMDLLYELKDWRRLALRLHFSFDEIRKIVADNDSKKEECIMEAMDKWLRRGPSSTIPALIKGLHGVQEHGIADRLRDRATPKPGVPLTSLPDGPLNSSEHLAFITKELRELIEWQDLGMQLGLSFTTLKEIGINNRENVQRCKMEMLDAWLQGRDNVHSQGGITKKALVDALERAELIALALKLDPAREKSHT